MKAYSLDLRTRIVQAVAAGQPRAAVARRFQVGLSTVQRLVSQYQAGGTLVPKHSPGRPRHIPAAAEPALVAQVAAMPAATLAEHSATWAQTHERPISIATMQRALTRLAWTRKKDSSTPVNKTLRPGPPGGRPSRPGIPNA